MRRRRVWAIGAAVVLLAAGVGFGVYRHYYIQPPTITYSDDLGSVLVSRDGLTIYTSVPAAGGDCSTGTYSELVAAETAASVQVRIRTTTLRASAPQVAGVCAKPEYFTASLVKPLGDRSLLDGTGRRIPYVSGRAFVTLPTASGWKLASSTPVQSLDGMVDDYDSNAGTITLTQETSMPSGSMFQITPAQADVHGRPAQLYTDPAGAQDLTWNESNLFFSLFVYGPTTIKLVDVADLLP
jgi:hypothetical protein